MTPISLREAIMEELEEIASGLVLYDEDGNETNINIYKQKIPNKQKGESQFPFACVTLAEGEWSEKLDSNIIVLISFGIVNKVKEATYDGRDTSGSDDIMELIQRSAQRFMTNPIVGKSFERIGSVKWAMDDENTWPYFFGGISLSFRCATFERERSEYI